MRPTLNMEGAVIGGRYLLKDLIGEGGMGGVWRAQDKTLQRDVAVKLLFSGDERDREQRISRFLREARIAAAVQHKNIVHIIDFGSTDGQRPFMVMEYLKGETLGGRLARSPAPTVEELVHITAATLGGLAAAHDAGVVHRDMKPENIFLVEDADGAYPKILDFGISRSVLPESGPSSALTTREGFLVGTPQYMSPEQARGLKDVDRATDIYSMGVILYEALTGRLPFNSEHVGDLIILIASGNTNSVSSVRKELGEPLSEVVRKAMRVERGDRYEGAREMRKDLSQALRRTDEAASQLLCPNRARKSITPRPTAATTAGRGGAEETGPEADRLSAAHAKTVQASGSNADATAPPSRVSMSSVETPNAWTVDQPGPGGTKRWVVGLAVALIIGLGAWVVIGQEPEPTTDAPTTASDPIPEPIATVDPAEAEPPPDEAVTLTIEGMPEGAAVTFDGEPIEGAVHRLLADADAHVFSVTAEGFEPREVTVNADGDATIDLTMIPLPPVIATPRMSMRRSMAPITMMGNRPPQVIQDLDY